MRGDSAYAREEIMKWCEEQPRVDYVLAMATNSQLQRRASDVITKAQNDYAKRLEPVSSLMEQMFSPEEEISEAEQLVRVNEKRCGSNKNKEVMSFE